MSISSTSATSSSSSTNSSATPRNRFDDMKTEDFLRMLIAELTHQDPTNPMSNQEMMAQIGQIQEIHANTRLKETLESVQLGQAMATASGLIGKTIIGLPDGESRLYEGMVAYVTIQDGKLHVDEKTISLTNVKAILSDALVDDGSDIPDEMNDDTTTTE